MKPSAFLDIVRERFTAGLAFTLGVFHLANVAGVLVLSTVVVRAVHLTAVLALIFLSMAPRSPHRLGARACTSTVSDVMLGLIALVTGAYLLARWNAIAFSGGLTNDLDIVVATVIVLLVLEATRRAVGVFLSAVTLMFLLYPFLSPYLGGMFYGRGVRFETVVGFLSLSGEGIYGIPIGVAATYIILFTIFGAFLSELGAGDYFFALSRTVTRGLRAASAKTAVIFSTLLGMISGSAAGNVAVTGAFTIPMMEREGYKAHQAAAIEAVVSTGGQIMPPVMGAAAFIMAEIVGTPYVNVMRVSLIPALLFFLSVFCVVHLQAVKSGIGIAVPAPSASRAFGTTLWRGIPFLVPFFGLIGMMIAGYSPVKASAFAIAALVGLHVIFARPPLEDLALRIGRAMTTGARSVVAISAACAAAGIISGILSMTGLGSKLSSFIISFSGGIPLIGLALTMIVAIILGMGLPTTASYLILATVVAPALADMGVPVLTAHLFVFFFGCVSTITPPVALASYVAAGIARADINLVGWTAFRYGLVCYLLPFAFAFGPGLLGQGGFWEVGSAVLTGGIGVFLLAGAIVGYLRAQLQPLERATVAIAGAGLLHQNIVTDIAGAVLVVALLARAHHRAERAAITGRRDSGSGRS
ncbi:MAG TPA: TRAP transporter fused permease subunit [Gammaproteobacteria bacterium]|nr:TRAP transporter fused permease subunit [Gammaproteobacteria bacterium]